MQRFKKSDQIYMQDYMQPLRRIMYPCVKTSERKIFGEFIIRLGSKKRDRATAGFGLDRYQNMSIAESQPKTALRTRAIKLVSLCTRRPYLD